MNDTLLSRRLTVLPKWYARLSEVVRISGAYLGVAAMVAVLMMVMVAPLRHKMEVVHQAALNVLAPSQRDFSAMLSHAEKPWVNPINLSDQSQMQALPNDPPELQIKPSAPALYGAALPPVLAQDVAAAKSSYGITETQLDALESYIARKYRVAQKVTNNLTDAAFLVSKEFEIDPILVLAVMAIESRFNPFAESGAGAQGLMQVMTRVHTDKFENLGHTTDAAFNPVINLRVGIKILYDCIKRRGSEVDGLKCYVGASGPDDGGYGERVQSERRRMALAASLPMKR
jgi:soluble lytic murein transglycosylase-like protein